MRKNNKALTLIAFLSLIIFSNTCFAYNPFPIAQNVDSTVKKIIQQLLEPMQKKGEVVKTKGNIVYLNLGAKYVKKGQQFRIVGLGEELIDPSTNLSLGYEQHSRCTIEIFEVAEQYSIGQIVGEITDPIQEKDLAIPLNSNYKIAVTQFSLPSNNSITENEAIYLQEKLIIALSKESNINVVERAQLDQVLEEYKLNNSGLIDESTAAELGRLLGVNALIIGNFVSWGDYLELTAKMVEINTGIILSATQIKINNAKETETQVAQPTVVQPDSELAGEPQPKTQLETKPETDTTLDSDPKVNSETTSETELEPEPQPATEPEQEEKIEDSPQVNVVVINAPQETSTPAWSPKLEQVEEPVQKARTTKSRFVGELEMGVNKNTMNFLMTMNGALTSEGELQELHEYLQDGLGFYAEMNLWPAKWLGIGAGYDMVYSSYTQNNFDHYNHPFSEQVTSKLNGPYGQILLRLNSLITLKTGIAYYFNSYEEKIKYQEATTDYYYRKMSGQGVGYLIGAQLTTPPLGNISIFLDATIRQADLPLFNLREQQMGEENDYLIGHENKKINYSGFRLSGGFAIHF